MIVSVLFSLVGFSKGEFIELPFCSIGSPDVSDSRAYTLPDHENSWNTTIGECRKVDDYAPRQSRRCCDSGAVALAKSASMILCRKSKGKITSFYSARFISGIEGTYSNPCVPMENIDICVKFPTSFIPTGSISKLDERGCQPYTLYTCNPSAKEANEICPPKELEPRAHIMAHLGSKKFCSDASLVKNNQLPGGKCSKVGKAEVATVSEMEEKLLEYGSLLVKYCFGPIKGYEEGVLDGLKPCSEAQKDQYSLIIGKGKTQDGRQYWLVQNTYGVNWAPRMQGHFKILSGFNQLGIESNVQVVDINYEENEQSTGPIYTDY